MGSSGKLGNNIIMSCRISQRLRCFNYWRVFRGGLSCTHNCLVLISYKITRWGLHCTNTFTHTVEKKCPLNCRNVIQRLTDCRRKQKTMPCNYDEPFRVSPGGNVLFVLICSHNHRINHSVDISMSFTPPPHHYHFFLSIGRNLKIIACSTCTWPSVGPLWLCFDLVVVATFSRLNSGVRANNGALAEWSGGSPAPTLYIDRPTDRPSCPVLPGSAVTV